MSHKTNQQADRRRNRWQCRQAKDVYVKAAQQSGWRSRAVFKLREFDERERLFRPGMRVLDLGAAPGGWSQYAATKVGDRGRIMAVDLLDMQPVSGVDFVRGDIRQAGVLERVLAGVDGGADLVMSDMAPNITGIASLDMPRALALAEVAFDVADAALAVGGVLLVKLFQGEGFDEYVAELKRRCTAVRVKKPAASRRESREMYVLATL